MHSNLAILFRQALDRVVASNIDKSVIYCNEPTYDQVHKFLHSVIFIHRVPTLRLDLLKIPGCNFSPGQIFWFSSNLWVVSCALLRAKVRWSGSRYCFVLFKGDLCLLFLIALFRLFSGRLLGVGFISLGTFSSPYTLILTFITWGFFAFFWLIFALVSFSIFVMLLFIFFTVFLVIFNFVIRFHFQSRQRRPSSIHCCPTHHHLSCVTFEFTILALIHAIHASTPFSHSTHVRTPFFWKMAYIEYSIFQTQAMLQEGTVPGVSEFWNCIWVRSEFYCGFKARVEEVKIRPGKRCWY